MSHQKPQPYMIKTAKGYLAVVMGKNEPHAIETAKELFPDSGKIVRATLMEEWS